MITKSSIDQQKLMTRIKINIIVHLDQNALRPNITTNIFRHDLAYILWDDATRNFKPEEHKLN
jgi:hypothetical protein